MNPYKACRIQENRTQQEVATLCDITVQVVTNLESGLYYKPPPSIAALFNLSPNLYTEWVKEERIANSHYFDYADTHNGWRQFRLSVNPTSFRGFCRHLVFQPSMLAEFEKYHRNSAALVEALRQVGITIEAVGRIVSPHV